MNNKYLLSALALMACATPSTSRPNDELLAKAAIAGLVTLGTAGILYSVCHNKELNENVNLCRATVACALGTVLSAAVGYAAATPIYRALAWDETQWRNHYEEQYTEKLTKLQNEAKDWKERIDHIDSFYRNISGNNQATVADFQSLNFYSKGSSRGAYLHDVVERVLINDLEAVQTYRKKIDGINKEIQRMQEGCRNKGISSRPIFEKLNRAEQDIENLSCSEIIRSKQLERALNGCKNKLYALPEYNAETVQINRSALEQEKIKLSQQRYWLEAARVRLEQERLFRGSRGQ